jgi:hypothetical protein
MDLHEKWFSFVLYDLQVLFIQFEKYITKWVDNHTLWMKWLWFCAEVKLLACLTSFDTNSDGFFTTDYASTRVSLHFFTPSTSLILGTERLQQKEYFSRLWHCTLWFEEFLIWHQKRPSWHHQNMQDVLLAVDEHNKSMFKLKTLAALVRLAVLEITCLRAMLSTTHQGKRGRHNRNCLSL